MSRLFALAVLLAPAPPCAETAYFESIEDLPLPPGFLELGASPGFDAPEGFIVLGYAAGPTAPDAVRMFYEDALPALGWALSPGLATDLVFSRGREQLTLRIGQGAGGTEIEARLILRARR